MITCYSICSTNQTCTFLVHILISKSYTKKRLHLSQMQINVKLKKLIKFITTENNIKKKIKLLGLGENLLGNICWINIKEILLMYSYANSVVFIFFHMPIIYNSYNFSFTKHSSSEHYLLSTTQYVVSMRATWQQQAIASQTFWDRVPVL